MPRLNANTDLEVINGMQGFQFSAIQTDKLGATEYTLVTIAIDVTGSTQGFEDQLRAALIAAAESCQKSPRKDNLLLRVLTFSSTFYQDNGVNELHGFTPLADIQINDYPQFRAGGMTPLYQATYAAAVATAEYGKRLTDDDFLVNAINFIITDGYDTEGKVAPNMIKKELEAAITEEKLESQVSILIGVNAQTCEYELEQFKNEAGLDKYIDAGDANKKQLAKLAEFVSQSISSQSQALGTGGPSQNIAAVI